MDAPTIAILIEIKDAYVRLLKDRTNHAHKSLESFVEPAQEGGDRLPAC